MFQTLVDIITYLGSFVSGSGCNKLVVGRHTNTIDVVLVGFDSEADV